MLYRGVIERPAMTVKWLKLLCDSEVVNMPYISNLCSFLFPGVNDVERTTSGGIKKWDGGDIKCAACEM
jgi:hypothetical protein